jgi:hypothetical protein
MFHDALSTFFSVYFRVVLHVRSLFSLPTSECFPTFFSFILFSTFLFILVVQGGDYFSAPSAGCGAQVQNTTKNWDGAA